MRDSRAPITPQDLAERIGDLQRPAARKIDGVATRAVEHRLQHELRAAVVRTVAEAQADRLVADGQRVLFLDLHEVEQVQRPVDADIEQQVAFERVAAIPLQVFGAEHDDALDAEPRQRRDDARCGERRTDQHRVADRALATRGSARQQRPEAEIGAEQGDAEVLVVRRGLARHPAEVADAVFVRRVGTD